MGPGLLAALGGYVLVEAILIDRGDEGITATVLRTMWRSVTGYYRNPALKSLRRAVRLVVGSQDPWRSKPPRIRLLHWNLWGNSRELQGGTWKAGPTIWLVCRDELEANIAAEVGAEVLRDVLDVVRADGVPDRALQLIRLGFISRDEMSRYSVAVHRGELFPESNFRPRLTEAP